MPNGIIESIRIAKRSEEAPRAFLVVSFSLRDAGASLLHLAQQIKNSVDVEFSNFQLAMAEPAAGEDTVVHKFIAGADAGMCDFCGQGEGASVHNYQAPIPLEHQTMDVDGEPADVVREPLSEAAQRLVADASGTTGATEAPWDNPHPHRPNGIDDLCQICGRTLMDAIHGEAPIDVSPHAFEDSDKAGICGVCGRAYEDESHRPTDSQEEAREQLATANGRRRK